MKKLEEEILEEKEKRSFLKISELSKDGLKNKFGHISFKFANLKFTRQPPLNLF